MTRNPYAQIGGNDPYRPGGGFDGAGGYGDGMPPQTSALAVASLIVSIVSLIVCCVPGPGVLGMFLALGAVISISRSQGRRTGLGMAIAGLLIGLIATIISLLLWIGISMGLTGFAGHRATLEAIWQRDATAAASVFEPASAAQITPERLESFVQEVESELGEYKGVPQGLGGLWSGYRQAGPAIEVGSQQPQVGQQVLPLPAEFDNGWSAVMLDLPPGVNPVGGPLPQLRNLGIVLPRARRVVWLIDPTLVGGTTPALPAPGGAQPATPPPAADGEGADEGGDAPEPEPAPEPSSEPAAPPEQPAPPADPDPSEPG